MSRSYKKPIVKDENKGGNWHNKLFRRTNKQRINSDREPKLMKELVNDWDICDWKYYPERWKRITEEEYNQLMRK